MSLALVGLASNLVKLPLRATVPAVRANDRMLRLVSSHFVADSWQLTVWHSILNHRWLAAYTIDNDYPGLPDVAVGDLTQYQAMLMWVVADNRLDPVVVCVWIDGALPQSVDPLDLLTLALLETSAFDAVADKAAKLANLFDLYQLRHRHMRLDDCLVFRLQETPEATECDAMELVTREATERAQQIRLEARMELRYFILFYALLCLAVVAWH